MGQVSAHGSAPVDDDDDDSSVDEMSPVKAKKPSRRVSMAKEKEPPKDWTMAEEITLCQAWCDVSENSEKGNNMKMKGFWEAVIKYFEKEIGLTRGITKGGSCDLNVYQKACAEYKMIYRHDFMLEHCYNILKDHQGWLGIETHVFYKNTKGRKKSKTSETTSGSASGAFNLNNEADEPEEEIQEKRAMGRDRAKAKKKSPASIREESSSFVDLLKNRELDIREAKRREAVELKREKLSTQRRTLELAEREKRDRDILFYNSEISSPLPAIQRQKLQEMKNEINERYHIDY
ncbi:ABC transporter G family member 7 isoform X2 [Tanacetum coccineum]